MVYLYQISYSWIQLFINTIESRNKKNLDDRHIRIECVMDSILRGPEAVGVFGRPVDILHFKTIRTKMHNFEWPTNNRSFKS
jgi:hypothetical protein